MRRVCLIYQPHLYSVCDIYKEKYKHKIPWLNIFQSKIRHRLGKQKTGSVLYVRPSVLPISALWRAWALVWTAQEFTSTQTRTRTSTRTSTSSSTSVSINTSTRFRANSSPELAVV